ncbi:hypothetical protein [Pararhodonellum marinum]|nr:hypothetical protein [Pararhodonellum marinum]
MASSPDPFPFDRIQRRKEIKSLIKTTRTLIEVDLVDDARVMCRFWRGMG